MLPLQRMRYGWNARSDSIRYAIHDASAMKSDEGGRDDFRVDHGEVGAFSTTPRCQSRMAPSRLF